MCDDSNNDNDDNNNNDDNDDTDYNDNNDDTQSVMTRIFLIIVDNDDNNDNDDNDDNDDTQSVMTGGVRAGGSKASIDAHTSDSCTMLRSSSYFCICVFLFIVYLCICIFVYLRSWEFVYLCVCPYFRSQVTLARSIFCICTLFHLHIFVPLFSHAMDDRVLCIVVHQIPKKTQCLHWHPR